MSFHAIIFFYIFRIEFHIKHFKFILGAASTTGIGECLMRSLCANEIALCMGRQKLMPNAAIKTAIDNMTKSIGGDGKY